MDQGGQPCEKAALTEDGLYLLQSGMTAQGYFDEGGRWLQRSELVGLEVDGTPLELKPSTLGVAQAAQAVDPPELLRHTINSVYALEPTAVDAGLATRAGVLRLCRCHFGARFSRREDCCPFGSGRAWGEDQERPLEMHVCGV
jgi:hypothetical protein